MKESASQMLDAGEMVPLFTLPTVGGRLVSLWHYKQREQVVLLLLPDPAAAGARRLLSAYSAAYPAFRAEKTEVLALLPLAPEQLDAVQARLGVLFPLLADAAGETLRRLASWEAARQAPLPTVLVADRYGALYMRYSAQEVRDLPAPAPVLQDLEYLALQCPECGAAAWPG
jgi:peroxiredoxin